MTAIAHAAHLERDMDPDDVPEPRPLAKERGGLRWQTACDLAESTPPHVDWIVRGWAARGSITEVVANIKGGKSTLVGHLVKAVTLGLPFLGRPPGSCASVLWLTEERQPSFRRLLERTGLLETEDLHVLLLQDRGSLTWSEVVADVLRKAQEIEAGVVVIDTISRWAGLAGDAENNAGAAQAAMEPLEQLAAAGLAVIMGRHSRKSGGEPQEAGRGSSAWSGVSDIVLQLTKPGASHPPTVRKLNSVSRFEETPDELLIQLTEQGYTPLGSEGAVAFAEAEMVLYRALSGAGGEMLQTELLKVRDDAGKPLGEGTARRVLDSWLRAGKAERSGAGGRWKDPYRWRWTGDITATPTSPVALMIPGLNGVEPDDPIITATPPSPVAAISEVTGGRLSPPRPYTEGGGDELGGDDLAWLEAEGLTGPPEDLDDDL